MKEKGRNSYKDSFIHWTACLTDTTVGRSNAKRGMQSTLIRVRSLISVSAVPAQWKIPILEILYICWWFIIYIYLYIYIYIYIHVDLDLLPCVPPHHFASLWFCANCILAWFACRRCCVRFAFLFALSGDNKIAAHTDDDTLPRYGT